MAKTSFYADTTATSTSVEYSFEGRNPVPINNFGEIVIVFDGGGAAVSTGIKVDVPIMFDCTIDSAVLVADAAGSIVVDILKAPVGTVPTASICASALPTLASALSSTDITLTGWTTDIDAADVLRFVVNSASGVNRVTLVLKITKG
jgi:hypothetical protein